MLLETYVRTCYNDEGRFSADSGYTGFAGVLLVRHFTAGPGDGWVVVSRDGVVEERLPLSEDTRLLLKDASGNENLLVIEGGSVRLEDADCPDRLCVRQGAISRSGESIICLPHKLVITIEGRAETDSSAPDAMLD